MAQQMYMGKTEVHGAAQVHGMTVVQSAADVYGMTEEHGLPGCAWQDRGAFHERGAAAFLSAAGALTQLLAAKI
eukprot:1156430-Pelagomonas_calceolata.AAC.8